MIQYFRQAWRFRPTGPESYCSKVSFRHWLWWVDNWILGHHVRLLCRLDLMLHGYSWRESGDFFKREKG